MRAEDLIYNIALASLAKEAVDLEGLWPSPQRQNFNPGFGGEVGYELANTFRHPLNSLAKVPSSLMNIGRGAWEGAKGLLPSMPSTPAVDLGPATTNLWDKAFTPRQAGSNATPQAN